MEPKCQPEPNAAIAPDATLVEAGWTQRFLVDPARADDLVDLYRQAGFEVTLHKPTPADFDARCGECPVTVCRTYEMLYTRPGCKSSAW